GAPETLAEAVIDPPEAAVRRACKSGVEHAHSRRQPVGTDLEHQVVVVAHQRERKHSPRRCCRDKLQRSEKQGTELIVEDDLLVVASRNDMVVLARLLVTVSAAHIPTVGTAPTEAARFTLSSHSRCSSVTLGWHRDMAAAAVGRAL